MSHSCDISNDLLVSIMPVYLEDELDEQKASALKGIPLDVERVSKNFIS